MNDTAQETTAVMTLLVEHEHMVTPAVGNDIRSCSEHTSFNMSNTQLPQCSKCSAHSSLLHTYFLACDISRVRAPAPIGCTHCSHLTHRTEP